MEGSKYSEDWFKTYPLQNGFEANLKYYQSGHQENLDFWNCFNGMPDLKNKTIIDVGCGHGSLCIDIALSESTSKVIGVDINEELVEFAKWNLQVNYPELRSRVDFYCIDLNQLPIYEVDIILSKASFEHIIELEQVLKAIKVRLKLGGKLFTGFMPLYHSPFGGHGRIHNNLPFPWLPWGHLIVSEKYILNKVNSKRQDPVASIYELGLNKLSVKEFETIFEKSGLSISFFKTNLPGLSLKAKLLTILSNINFFRKYTTFSIFSILEKRV